MPIALEARKNRFDYVLKADRDKPAEEQPSFSFRVLNLRRFKAAAVPLDAKPESGPAMIDSLLSVISPVLVGWKNMRTAEPEVIEAFGLPLPEDGIAVDLPFAADKLEILLNVAELRELLGAAMSGGITEGDLKN